MRRSDGQSSEGEELNNNNASLDETAHSIHQQNADQDKEMASMDTPLKRFIREELKLELKLDDLEHHDHIFKDRQSSTFLPPFPPIYFLSHQLLVFDRTKNVTDIREDILKLRKQYEIRYFSQTEQLHIKLHNKSQLINYNLRVIRNDPSLHRNKQFLDPRHLIDLLFQYYCVYYQKLHFQDTASLVLYWAYQKEILNHEISEHALKLIIICSFANFGYGVLNIIYHSLNNKEILKENGKMFAYARINNKGETEIDEDLKKYHINYTIEEKRGFYMASKKRFMQIKDIIPICYPIVPLKPDLDAKYREQIRHSILPVLQNDKQKMSICKNIYKIFKFLHNKFDKRMKLVIDFEESLAYRQQFAQNFQLQILHPVLNKSICSIKDQSIRKLRGQINSVYEGFSKSLQPVAVIKDMLAKKR